MGKNDIPLDGLYNKFHPPLQNRWPIDFFAQEAAVGTIILIGFVGFAFGWGLLAFIIFLLKGRHAKDNWKSQLEVDDDDVKEKRKGAGVRVSSVKRLQQEPDQANPTTAIQIPRQK